ncbi:squalene/phytoene synthase family protein [Roseomonas sp. SSH11]|uniref:Squalene/phytoene synthase family protein n=1 Tax=Pararoseomonas baculiformis TaxID=2820812 RepID=A0ABS4ADL8_9PROT|nr:squalene/phytoene synthase family protein [Pararoseomonas baculiformis]MBP0444324.1 squalene/phytoene synthase family protein [Pararoseomonas baculiformis]
MSASIAAGPATRGPDSENFPVASRLLAPEMRGRVLAFYRVVRLADDIADAPDLQPAEKLRRLDLIEAALDGGPGVPEATALRESGAGVQEARAMLTAFRRDARNEGYEDWNALADYCAHSANPVGRMLLRLHGEAEPAAFQAADALCTALQVLNHLQDMGDDRRELGRIYLPRAWMEQVGGEETVFIEAAPRRAVLDALLDRTDTLLDMAAALPRLLKSRRLAFQSATTIGCARRLLARLRAADPMAGRVALTRLDFLAALAAAPSGGPSDARLVRARVARAGSSFSKGMASLRGERRRALYAVYAFCRAVDDIADGATPEAEKRQFLAEWRRKLDAPDCAVSRELSWARAAFDLPRSECEAMIEGMETDSTARLRIPDEAALDLYCRRVAGSVGVLSVRIFGAPEAEAFGLALGRTLQLVNILRDIDEDAVRDRVYIPLSWLGPDADADTLLSRPDIHEACHRLLARAEDGFAAAEAALAGADAKTLRPARVMMWAYHRILQRLAARGFHPPRLRPHLGRAEKARLAVMALGW